MPRPSKGPRLYLRTGRIDSRSGKRLPDVYFIRDGADQVSTGCGPDSLPAAERRLAAYIAEKWTPQASSAAQRGDPAHVLVAEVLALYTRERAPHLARSAATTSAYVRQLLTWWGEKSLADVKRSTCREYVAERITHSIRAYSDRGSAPKVTTETARIELEVLSAAIGYWDGEHKLNPRPKVWLPEKGETQRDALTRSQAAALLWAAMGFRKGEEGRWRRIRGSSAANRKHIRRFLLIGFYSGSRPGVAPKLLWEESATHPWVDLDKAIIYRRGKRVREQRTKKTPVVKIAPRLLAHMRRWKRIDDRLCSDDKLDTNAVIHHGGEMLGGRIRTGFDGVVADAGLDGDITPHWMRHTCATWLMEKNVDMWLAAGFAGMTVEVLEKHYAHHRPDYQQSAAKAVSGK